ARGGGRAVSGPRWEGATQRRQVWTRKERRADPRGKAARLEQVGETRSAVLAALLHRLLARQQEHAGRNASAQLRRLLGIVRAPHVHDGPHGLSDVPAPPGPAKRRG